MQTGDATGLGLFEFVAYAEIDPFPCHVLHHRLGASRPRYMPDPSAEGLSEKEKKARAAAIRNVSGLPEAGVPNFGDIEAITDDDLRQLGPVDVLEGGSPCQAFSIAGKRLGMDDPRGRLLQAFCELAERMRLINGLQFVLWENVHHVLSERSNGFGYLLASLAGETSGPLQRPGRRWRGAGRVLGRQGREVRWQTIETSKWGLPQRRKRCFVVASLRDRTGGLGPSAASEVLAEPEGSGWHPEQGRKARQVVVSTFRRGDRLEYVGAEERSRDPKVLDRLQKEASRFWIGTDTGYAGPYAADREALLPVDGSGLSGAAGQEVNVGKRQVIVHPKIAGTLCASGAGLNRPAGMGSELDFVVITKPVLGAQLVEFGPPTFTAHYGPPDDVDPEWEWENEHSVFAVDVVDENPERWAVRRFTPLECERLQGFPDHWTDVPFKGKLVADIHRYKALGNTMSCPVMAYIGGRLSAVIDVYDFADRYPELLQSECEILVNGEAT